MYNNMKLIIGFLYCYSLLIHIDMPSLRWIANNVKTTNNELDKAKQQKRDKLKEDIKHRQKGVGLKKK